MGVQFDRILDGFDGPFEKLTDFAKVPAGTITTAAGAGRLLLQPPGERQLHRRSTGCWRPAKTCRGSANGPLGPRHVLRRREADDARDLSEGGDGARRQLPGGGDRAGGTGREAARAAHRAVRHVRRHGMPSGWTRLDPRELRVPVRARVSARPRQRRTAREVRRARLQRRRARSGGGGGRGGGRGAGGASAPAAARRGAPAARRDAGRRVGRGGGAAAARASRRRRFPRSSRGVRARCRRRRSSRSGSS